MHMLFLFLASVLVLAMEIAVSLGYVWLLNRQRQVALQVGTGD